MAVSRKQTTFRLSDASLERLDALCTAFGVSRNQWLVSEIDAVYDRLNGDKEAKAVLEQMMALKTQLERLSGRA